MKPRRPVVALVTDAVYPYHRGGKELRYHELTRRLATRADVHVYTMQWWEGPRTRADDGVTFHAISRLLPMYVGDRRSMRQALLFALACFRLLSRRFDVLEADHIPYFQILVLRLVTWIRRKRLVVTWHEVWGPDYWRGYLGRAGTAAWAVESLAMRLPDHIVAASEQTAARLRAIIGPRAAITVAPNGIDPDPVRNAHPSPDISDLVVVSRLIQHKRIDMLLDVVALLHAEGMPVTCRIIGDGPARADLHERAQRLGVADAVDFRHDVHEHKDVYSLVKAAKVFVFPSEREGFGIAVLEALACKVPVVTTSAPDNLARHLVAGPAQGIVCEPSATAAAAAVKAILTGPRPAATATADESLLARFGWDTVTDQVAKALRI